MRREQIKYWGSKKEFQAHEIDSLSHEVFLTTFCRGCDEAHAEQPTERQLCDKCDAVDRASLHDLFRCPKGKDRDEWANFVNAVAAQETSQTAAEKIISEALKAYLND
jgi:hypothetical protein